MDSSLDPNDPSGLFLRSNSARKRLPVSPSQSVPKKMKESALAEILSELSEVPEWYNSEQTMAAFHRMEAVGMDDLKATAISLGLSTGSFVITLILFSDWY
jgi:hypothetical protein